jgi:hypothetical protein
MARGAGGPSWVVQRGPTYETGEVTIEGCRPEDFEFPRCQEPNSDHEQGRADPDQQRDTPGKC